MRPQAPQRMWVTNSFTWTFGISFALGKGRSPFKTPATIWVAETALIKNWVLTNDQALSGDWEAPGCRGNRIIWLSFRHNLQTQRKIYPFHMSLSLRLSRIVKYVQIKEAGVSLIQYSYILQKVKKRLKKVLHLQMRRFLYHLIKEEGVILVPEAI